jgi:hypothetical protein
MYGSRAVNERLRELNETFAPLLGTYLVACECDDAACDETVEIPQSEFARAHAGGEAVVHPAHVRGARIVVSRDGWAVVQK